MVLTGKTLSSAGHRWTTGERATTRALRVVTVQPRRAGRPKWLTDRANSAGTVAQSRPSTVPPFLWIFNFFTFPKKSCKIQK
jgi:hypothetical protein